jgi:outer membrane protein, adhesin transport system
MNLTALGESMRFVFGLLIVGSILATPAVAKNSFSIIDAINQATQSNPGVGEASANRRATEAELRQNQSTLLPQVRLEASIGPHLMDRYSTPTPIASNNKWISGREASVAVRQLLYDGFSSIHEIWRQAARVDAAAARVLERTELIALSAAEAYIDVVRYLQLIQLASSNVQKHRSIFSNVRARFEGGRTGEGDMQQSQERVSSTEAVLAEFRQRLDEARAAYRNAVGLEPFNLRFPGGCEDCLRRKTTRLQSRCATILRLRRRTPMQRPRVTASTRPEVNSARRYRSRAGLSMA